MMQVNDAQFLVAYAKEIADGSKRRPLPEMPMPNEDARLKRLRQDPEYGHVVALLDRIVGL